MTFGDAIAILLYIAQVTAIGTYAAWLKIAMHPRRDAGNQVPNGTVTLDVSGNCQSQLTRERRYWNKDGTQHRHAVFVLPCRKCRNCLKRRGGHWSMRIAAEISSAPRTWFVTLTLAPDRRAIYAMRSEVAQRKRGNKWHELSDAEKFRALHSEISKEITLYLKRVRERAGAPLRFALECEQHKDGYPHFHAVIHETEEGSVRYRDVIEPWTLGFAHAKLVQADQARKAASYVAKYLSKNAMGRVRASRDYGSPQPPQPPRVLSGTEREKSLTHTGTTVSARAELPEVEREE